MNKSNITLPHVGFLFLLFLLSIFPTIQAVAKQPNFLFIFADDQSPFTLSAYGNTVCRTPNLDRLAREGMVLDGAYHMGSWSGAVCTPSRTMVQTAINVWRTEAIAKQPHSVLLLDEVEKAHPDVFNLLLQVMDHGTLTDNNGRKADFRNVVIVMTTNAGASEISRPSIGFTHQDHSSDGMEAIRKLFSPEFRNRLDAIIQFRSLDPAVITRVVDKFIYELEAQLQEKGVTLDVEDSAREWLAEHGFDAKMGARPMARVIQEHIKKPLAEELLFGRLSNGGHLIIRAEDDRLVQDIRQEEEVL